MRRKPYSVILFDEIEKAHPDVMNILLQILDDGRITDAHGRTVNFENTIIVMTSNAGSDRREGTVGFNRAPDTVAKEKALKALREFLRPEFLGVLMRSSSSAIWRRRTTAGSRRSCSRRSTRARRRRGSPFPGTTPCSIGSSDKAGAGERSGARELRHTIRREVEDRLAALLVEQEGTLQAVSFTVQDGEVLTRTLTQ